MQAEQLHRFFLSLQSNEPSCGMEGEYGDTKCPVNKTTYTIYMILIKFHLHTLAGMEGTHTREKVHFSLFGISSSPSLGVVDIVARSRLDFAGFVECKYLFLARWSDNWQKYVCAQRNGEELVSAVVSEIYQWTWISCGNAANIIFQQ